MKVIIVGGVAGGASAAARLRRLDEEAEIVLFERGPYISYANCGLPYYIGGAIKERDRLLVMTPEVFSKRFKVDVRVGHEVVRIIREKKEVEVREGGSGETYIERYDKLVLSPGAEPLKPSIPGVDLEGVFVLRTVPDAEAIKRWIESKGAKTAVVVGAGPIGVEMAENLSLRGIDVYLVELLDQVIPALDPEMAWYVSEHMAEKGIKLFLGKKVVGIQRDGGGLKLIMASGEEIPADLVLFSAGVRPEVKLAREAGLTLGPRGGIKVDEFFRTSDPDIFAIGDAIEVREWILGEETLIPLAGPANRQGRLVADILCGRGRPYRGTLATAVIKAFDLTVAMTGINEKILRDKGLSYERLYLHPYDHATYYPGASQMHIKVIFSRPEGRILGAQVVGKAGVDKRIDVLATAIRSGMTVFDLRELDLAYSPPYGSAKDPVNMVGFAASNCLEGLVEVAHWDEVEEGDFLLDVRSPLEVAAGAVPRAVNIPLEQLRQRLDELPRDRPIKVFCAVGIRSYVATRILAQKGFWVKNLSGGYLTYKAFLGIGKVAQIG